MENAIDRVQLDLIDLAQSHEYMASNEHLWALGSEDGDIAAMHETNAERHRELAELYRRMSESAESLTAQFGRI